MTTRMTTLPVPRYAIGQQVYCASVRDGSTEVPCPDCVKTGKWNAVSPAGTIVPVTCPRCSGYGVLKQRCYVARVELLTIGSIRLNTAPHSSEDAVVYMCHETGIGSGNLWNESKLFLTREEANVVGEAECSRMNEELDKHDPRRAEFRYLSEYQMKEALIGEEQNERRRIESKFRRLKERIFELSSNTYLIQPGEFAEESEGLNSGSLALDEKHVNLLQEHLCFGDEEMSKQLISWRAEKDECQC